MRITNKWIKCTDSKVLSHVYIPKVGLHSDNQEDIFIPMKDKLKNIRVVKLMFTFNI